MNRSKIIVAGIGPGSEADITLAVLIAVQGSDIIVGYKYYFRFITHLPRERTGYIDTGMKREQARAEQAFAYANEGETICMTSSDDAGIYGMTPLTCEMRKESGGEIEIESYPGISALQKTASLLGTPIGHGFCVVSFSDLMTPRELIEKRIHAATMADFVMAIYNPRSGGRYWQLYRLEELLLQERKPETPVGYVCQAGREEQEVFVTTLTDLDSEQIDIFTVVLIGNSQTYLSGNHMITPRGYYGEIKQKKVDTGIGQDIMARSFRTVEKELKDQEVPLDKKWALLHAIHTTADFNMEDILYTDPDAVSTLYSKISGGEVPTIITDVMIAASSIRRGALQRLGVEMKRYLQDEQAAEMASSKGITHTQAGIRQAVEEHPTALFVFGNAPTAFMELCDLIHKSKTTPAGIITAPAGFVHVQESKRIVKPLIGIPKLIVGGRKGGSNLTATLVSAILCFNDTKQLKPGRGV